MKREGRQEEKKGIGDVKRRGGKRSDGESK